MLTAAGITTGEIRGELRAGRWVQVGPNTIAVPRPTVPGWQRASAKHDGQRLGEAMPTGLAPFWWAVWESGTAAALDGASSLVAQGMTGFTLTRIDVSVPQGSRVWRHPGITVTRRRDVGRVLPVLPRVEPATATIRAAQLATSDRQAALLICLPVQQRIVAPAHLLDRWRTVRRSPRHTLLGQVIADVCDGAHSLGELDFAALCRRTDLPEPRRQQLRRGPRGRIYLDNEFACGLVVEIDGAQHGWGLAPVEDALRANALALQSRRVLRIPVIGLRLNPQAFMAQVAAGIRLMTLR